MVLINYNTFCLFLTFVTAATAAHEVNDRYYPRYHLAPPYGWMNDPNGFGVYRNEYHLFYQYNPNSSLEPGIAHWGHAKSADLFHWVHLPIAMYPDQPYDKSGVFSGSAIVEDGTMYLFYTGNVNHPGENPDHEQHQCLATNEANSDKDFVKYFENPIIQGNKHQPNFRDPKVWKHGDAYYMVLGNSFQNNSLGRVLLYRSTDRIIWNEVSVLHESNGTLGYMWECPDFFELNGFYVLLFSPQGVEPQGDKYRNIYQVGYFVGKFDYETYEFVALTEFRELDHGNDFYATQTMKKGNRRILVAWFDMWDQNYPEGPDGFTGCMTIARELTLNKKLQLIQKPVSEIHLTKGHVLRRGRGNKGDSITLPDKAGEVVLEAPGDKNVEVVLSGVNGTVTLTYDASNKTITLNRGGKDGIRRTQWRPRGKLNWIIYVDASTIELFTRDGEVTFSSRFFPEGPITVGLGKNTKAQQFKVTQIRRTIINEHIPTRLPKYIN